MVFLVKPNDCSNELRDAFRRIVDEGEAVAPVSHEKIMKAQLLAFAYVDGEVGAVAAIKNPTEQYRKGCFEKAKAKSNPDHYMYELGWVSVCPTHRGKKIPNMLVEHLLSNFNANLFATSLDPTMIKTLYRNDFVVCGRKYESKEHPGQYLKLFIWNAPKTPPSPETRPDPAR